MSEESAPSDAPQESATPESHPALPDPLSGFESPISQEALDVPEKGFEDPVSGFESPVSGAALSPTLAREALDAPGTGFGGAPNAAGL
jgi:hypothetical protein